MKNNKGFTLVELVAVVAILIALSTIAVVSVTATLKKSKKDINKVQNKLYAEAVKACYLSEDCPCDNNKICSFSVKSLVDNGYIDSDDVDSSVINDYYSISVNDKSIGTSQGGSKIKITGSNDSSYPWKLENGVWKSTTQGKNSTTTNLTFDFTLASAGKISFDWSVSSESATYDYIYYTITKDETTISGTGTSTKIGGTSYGTSEVAITYINKSINLQPGNYKITFTYIKDSSAQKGTDTGYVKNLTIS